MNSHLKKMIKNEKIFFIGGSYNDKGADKGAYKTIEAANKHITKLFNEYCNK